MLQMVEICVISMLNYSSHHEVQVKGKGKVHPRAGHEDPEVE
jgi:hypothetical protein